MFFARVYYHTRFQDPKESDARFAHTSQVSDPIMLVLLTAGH